MALSAILLLSYNNCGQQQFLFSKVEKFNPFDVEDVECTSMVVLPHPGDGILYIPKRNGSGVCYAVKLASSVPYHNSLTNENFDTSVIADDHSVAGREINNYLRKLGEKITRIHIEGPRAIKLSGSSDGLSEIKVDNIILVGIMPTSELYTPAYYKAYGTEDCRVWPQSDLGQNYPFNEGNFIAFGPNYDPVPVKAFASAGTASVAPFRIDGVIELQRDYTIDYRGLDCGGSAEATDIYLTFE